MLPSLTSAADEDEEELEAKKRRWGSTYKSHPGVAEDSDLDALLNNATRKDKDVKKEEPSIKQEIKSEDHSEAFEGSSTVNNASTESKHENIKSEPLESESGIQEDVKLAIGPEDAPDPGVSVVFKKRKAKNIRQK